MSSKFGGRLHQE